MKPPSSDEFRDPRSNADLSHLGIRRAVWIEASICFTYAILIIAVPSSLIRQWIDVSSPLTDAILFLVPRPREVIGDHYQFIIYRHVLAASLLISIASFLSFRDHWDEWRMRASAVLLRMQRDRVARDELTRTGYYGMILGGAGAAALLLYGDYQLEGLGGFLYQHSWTFLRAPALATSVFAFACHAVALRSEAISTKSS